jgi:hypothetical protein
MNHLYLILMGSRHQQHSLIFHPFIIPYAIKNLLNGERFWGGGQPCGLAAAPACGRRPPKAGGGHTKYQRLAFRNSKTLRGDTRDLGISHPLYPMPISVRA